MRLLHASLSLILLLLTILLAHTSPVVPSSTQLSVSTASSAVNSNLSEQQASKFGSIRYSVSDSSQVEVLPNDDQIPTKPTTDPSAVDPTFAKLSRQAFFRLNQGQQSIKPIVQPDEERRLLWLNSHQRHKEDKKGANQSPGKGQVMTLTTVDQLDRNQTCKSDMFKHKIRMAGCEPKIISNRFCHGSCSSFYIPKLLSKKLKATFKSCAACVPVETDYVQVQLDCPDRPEKQMFRTVVRIKSCACRNIQFGDENDEDY